MLKITTNNNRKRPNTLELKAAKVHRTGQETKEELCLQDIRFKRENIVKLAKTVASNKYSDLVENCLSELECCSANQLRISEIMPLIISFKDTFADKKDVGRKFLELISDFCMFIDVNANKAMDARVSSISTNDGGAFTGWTANRQQSCVDQIINAIYSANLDFSNNYNQLNRLNKIFFCYFVGFILKESKHYAKAYGYFSLVIKENTVLDDNIKEFRKKVELYQEVNNSKELFINLEPVPDILENFLNNNQLEINFSPYCTVERLQLFMESLNKFKIKPELKVTIIVYFKYYSDEIVWNHFHLTALCQSESAVIKSLCFCHELSDKYALLLEEARNMAADFRKFKFNIKFQVKMIKECVRQGKLNQLEVLHIETPDDIDEMVSLRNIGYIIKNSQNLTDLSLICKCNYDLLHALIPLIGEERFSKLFNVYISQQGSNSEYSYISDDISQSSYSEDSDTSDYELSGSIALTNINFAGINSQIKSFKVYDNDYNKNYFGELINCIVQNKNFERLCLSQANLSADEKELFFESLELLEQLKEFDLGDTEFEDEDALNLFTSLCKSKAKLETLSVLFSTTWLDNQNYSNVCITKLYNYIANGGLKNCKKLMLQGFPIDNLKDDFTESFKKYFSHAYFDENKLEYLYIDFRLRDITLTKLVYDIEKDLRSKFTHLNETNLKVYYQLS